MTQIVDWNKRKKKKIVELLIKKNLAVISRCPRKLQQSKDNWDNYNLLV